MSTTASNAGLAPGPSFGVVIASAGTGVRMGGSRKPFLDLCGRPVLHHTIERFLQTPGCAQIVPVLHAEDYANADLLAQLRDLFGIATVVQGGPTRQASVLAGLEAARPDLSIVLIHDAVRPLVDPAVIRRVAEAAEQHGAALAAVPARDTVKREGRPRHIVATVPRDGLWLARTPQGFRRDLILRAHYAARDQGFTGTDDAQLVERLGEQVVAVQDNYNNLKITMPEDLAIAEALLRWRAAQQA